MRINTENARNCRPIRESVVLWIAISCLVLLACREYSGKPKPTIPSPPDLSHGTRIEISYLPSTLRYFFPGSSSPGSTSQRLLSPEERQHLEEIKKIEIHDRETIRAFAQDISRAEYLGPNRSYGIANAASVACYQDDEQLTSFMIIGGFIQTDDGREFERKDFRVTSSTLVPQIWRFKERVECGGHLLRLNRHLSMYAKDKGMYPPSQKWCDVLFHVFLTAHHGGKYTVESFKCPSRDKGKCHYAMNPNCKPDSSLYTVLLFETKAGWNQHGGPELFTFDNHDPKGGCVLLNDGTVKFIRTKEELQQLRWK